MSREEPAADREVKYTFSPQLLFNEDTCMLSEPPGIAVETQESNSREECNKSERDIFCTASCHQVCAASCENIQYCIMAKYSYYAKHTLLFFNYIQSSRMKGRVLLSYVQFNSYLLCDTYR